MNDQATWVEYLDRQTARALAINLRLQWSTRVLIWMWLVIGLVTAAGSGIAVYSRKWPATLALTLAISAAVSLLVASTMLASLRTLVASRESLRLGDKWRRLYEHAVGLREEAPE